jgi:hypothetical protein
MNQRRTTYARTRSGETQFDATLTAANLSGASPVASKRHRSAIRWSYPRTTGLF